MSRINNRSLSPMRWTGVEKSYPTNEDGRDRQSYGLSFLEGRDDVDSRDAAPRSETPDEKVRKFDDLLKRIEAERTKVSRSSSHGAPSPSYYVERGRSSARDGAADVSSRSFADRSRELRITSDTPPRPQTMSSTTPPLERLTSRDYPSPSTRERFGTPSSPFKIQIVEQFHTNLSSAHDTIISLESEVRALKKQLSDKEGSISSLERRNKTLNETIAVSDDQAKEAEQEIKKLKDTNKELSRMCDEEMKLLSDRCENQKEKMVALERRNTALNETVSINRDRANEAEEERKKLAEENKRLTNRYDEHVAELTAECESYRKHANEIEHFSAECDAALKDLRQEMRDTAKKHSKEIQELTSECKSYKKAAEQAADLEQRSVDLQNTIEEIRNAKEELQSTISDRDRTIKTMENRIKQLEVEFDDAKRYRSQAFETSMHAQKLEAELMASKEEHETVMKEILDLEQRLETMTEVTEKSASRISEKDDQIQKLTSTLTSTENESRRIKQKAEMLMKKFDETKHENELLVGKVKDLEKHLMRADVATEEKSVEIKQLQVELANSQRKLEDLQQELETKIKRFEEYESECSKEQENMAALESAIEELVSNHDESTAEISRLQEENQNLKKALSAAQSDSKVEVLKLTKEKSVCLKDLQNASEEITKLKQENQTLSGNFEAAMTQSGEEVIKLREEIARLSKDLDTARNTASNETIELQNEIDCLSSTLNEAEEYVKMYMNDMQDAMKLRSQMREIEDLNQELSAKLSGKEAQIEEHKKNEASFSASLESLRLALHEKESELEKLSANKNKISQNEGESDQLRVRELEQKLVNLRTRCAASEEDSSEMKHDLQMKLEAAMKKLKKREEQLESSKAGLANAQSMILKLVKTVEELRKKVKQEKETQ